ncbi:hypothetical protein ACKAV7_002114 [Fusarium commune]
MAAPPAVKDDEIAKHHLTLHSKYFPGKFHRAFPGPQASVPQRRQYKYAFCKWYHGPEDFEVTKSRVCRLEKDLAAEVLIKRPEHREMKVSLFEWSVDSMFWELCYRLRTHPSLALDIPPFQTSGVDCLVNLIRHTNAILDKRSSTQIEEENLLLAYVWQAFFPREVDQELTNHRITVKAVLDYLKDRISETLTFEGYCNSDLMNKTLWSSDEWLLYKSNRSGTSPTEARRQGGVASLIEYDCRLDPGLTLQDAVDNCCTLQQKQIHLELRLPKFVRIRY